MVLVALSENMAWRAMAGGGDEGIRGPRGDEREEDAGSGEGSADRRGSRYK